MKTFKKVLGILIIVMITPGLLMLKEACLHEYSMLVAFLAGITADIIGLLIFGAICLAVNLIDN
jgi:hypothetical protein